MFQDQVSGKKDEFWKTNVKHAIFNGFRLNLTKANAARKTN